MEELLSLELASNLNIIDAKFAAIEQAINVKMRTVEKAIYPTTALIPDRLIALNALVSDALARDVANFQTIQNARARKDEMVIMRTIQKSIQEIDFYEEKIAELHKKADFSPANLVQKSNSYQSNDFYGNKLPTYEPGANLRFIRVQMGLVWFLLVVVNGLNSGMFNGFFSLHKTLERMDCEYSNPNDFTKSTFWQVVARIIVISEIIYRFMVMPFIASLSGVAQATFLEYFMWPCFPLVSWFVYVIFLMVKCTYLYGFRSDYRAVVWATPFIIFCHFIGFIATVAAKEDLGGPWLWVNHNLHYWSWELGQKITRF